MTAYGWNRPNVKAQCLLFTYSIWMFRKGRNSVSHSDVCNQCYKKLAEYPWQPFNSVFIYRATNLAIIGY